jgi:raffinose/stachyose/melibiose transport system permease protein
VSGISLVYTAYLTPTIALIMRSVFASVPRELLEAAKIDGCNLRVALVRVVLPVSRGGFVSVRLLGLIFVWSEVQCRGAAQPTGEPHVVDGSAVRPGPVRQQPGSFFAGLVIAILHGQGRL